MGNIVDITGKRYGKLTVQSLDGIRNHHSMWSCRCDCGNIKSISGIHLRKGYTKHCGCSLNENRIIDLKGKKFGKWTVLNIEPIKHPDGYHWYCECECGTKKIMRSSNLRNGSSKSCGCGRKLDQGESAFNWLYNNYKINSKKRNIPFNLTKDEAKELMLQNCHYCGDKPKNIIDRSSSNANGVFIYNGIDRLDNTKGYTKDNCVTACKICNSWKSDNTKKDLINHAKKILNFQN